MAKHLPKALTAEEFKSLIKAVPKKDTIARVSFLLAAGAGLRVSEIVGYNDVPALRKEQIDRTANKIQIISGKGGKDRVVPLPKGWRNWMDDMLPLSQYRGATPRSLGRKFKKYAKKAGLPQYYSFHSLRHFFGTNMIENGAPLSHVQLLMGHSSISTTSVYLKARPTDALKSYEELF